MVYLESPAVTSKYPKAPAPFACTTRSGMGSRSKCESFSRRWTSCSPTGPRSPAAMLFWSSATGIPKVVGNVFCHFSWVLLFFWCPIMASQVRDCFDNLSLLIITLLYSEKNFWGYYSFFWHSGQRPKKSRRWLRIRKPVCRAAASVRCWRLPSSRSMIFLHFRQMTWGWG